MDPAQNSSHLKFIGLLRLGGEAALSTRDEQEFFKSLCDIFAGSELFQFAWFGYADERARKIVRPLVHSEDHSGFLEAVETGLYRTDYEDSSNIALQTGKPCWIRDLRDHANPMPNQSAALERGYTSVISTPVNWDHRPRGALTLYYSDPDCFGQFVPDALTEWLRTNRFKTTWKPSPHFSPEQSEAELRALIDVVPQHIALFSADLHALYYNRVALDYFGCTWEEILSGRILDVTHPDDLEELVMKSLLGRERGVRFEYEIRLRRHDGEFRWFWSALIPLRDEQGSIIRWCGIANDIHDRKLAEERLQIENIALREEVDRASMFEEIVGTSKPLKAVLSRIAKVAPTDSTVLITGETGTGKELIARAVHKRSRRAGRAFISVNCAALPPTLVTSELFGHEKGAFTGATQRRLGRFEMADRGTIFPGRGGRTLTRHPGRVVESDTGTGIRASRRRAAYPSRRSRYRRHESRLERRRSKWDLPRGSPLSAECVSHRNAAFARTEGRHFNAGRVFRATLRQQDGQKYTIDRPEDLGSVAVLRLAWQHP
jgi:PAS domain S-box-containing protein